MRITGLFVYPIKGCRAVSVDAATLEPRGFMGDRRWLVVDDRGVFMSQRETPRLALVRCSSTRDGLLVAGPGAGILAIPSSHEHGARITVRVWSSTCEAVEYEAGSRWFSEQLGRPCRLAYMPGDVRRPVAGQPGTIVSFADTYPYLLTTESSLADLNARLAAPVAMARFRPNIVVDGTTPYAEDGWIRIRRGDLALHATKACDRCSVVTVDPDTGERGTEPLTTLASYRKRDGKVWFGINLVAETGGVLRVGDEVTAEI